jgi:hypothetical protein
LTNAAELHANESRVRNDTDIFHDCSYLRGKPVTLRFVGDKIGTTWRIINNDSTPSLSHAENSSDTALAKALCSVKGKKNYIPLMLDCTAIAMITRAHDLCKLQKNF